MNDPTHELTAAHEAAILASLMVRPERLADVDFLRPDDFADERHGLLFATIRHRWYRSESVDVYALADHFAATGTLAERFGPDAVTWLLDMAAAEYTADLEGTARIVQRHATARRCGAILDQWRGDERGLADSPAALIRQLQDATRGGTDRPRPLALGELFDQYPDLRPPVIEGLLREGETMNVIAAPKIGKSWFAYGLALSVATGTPFLGRFPTRRGRVLLLDNELHPETLSARLQTVISALGLQPSDVSDWLTVVPLRGRSADVHRIADVFAGIEPGDYALIVCDAFYRLLPDGTSENDNAQMTAVYNAIDRYGARLKGAFVLIHHSSKGDQSGKALTDVGAGAGAISRAADAHVVLRPHEEADSVVMQAAVRSWPKFTPIGLRWWYPTWTTDGNLDPEKLQGRRIPVNSEEAKQSRLDDKADRVLTYLRKLGPTGGTKSKIRDGSGVNHGLTQVLDQLTERNLIEACKVRIESNGQEFDGWRSVAPWLVSVQAAAADESHAEPDG